MPRPSKHKSSDALDYLWEKYYAKNPKARASLEEVRVNALIARQIYAIRKQNKLTQKALAELVGTTTSVICQLEDSDYEGHSLRMLQKIGDSLNRKSVFIYIEEGQRVVIKNVISRKITPKAIGRKVHTKTSRRKGADVVLE